MRSTRFILDKYISNNDTLDYKGGVPMRQLTYQDRYYIEIELKYKTPVQQIAKKLGVSRTAIYNEIEKGQCEQIDTHLRIKLVYLSDYAQKKHEDAVSKRGRKKKLAVDDEYLQAVTDKVVDERYSPEAAIHTIPGRKICAKTYYNYVHAGYIPGITENNLPYAKKKKGKKEPKPKRLTKGRSIEQRSEVVKERKEVGHWEMDTVYSSQDDKTCLLVLTERVKREELIFQIPDRTANSVVKALDRLERKIGSKTFRERFKTITCDNGMEFSNWEGIEKSIRNKTSRTVVYFCHPYCSGERGSNENQNKMIRRWIPKGDDIGLYSPEEIQRIQEWINNYPRKMFGWKSTNDMIA